MPRKPKARVIELPYSPRKAFMPFHERKQRWACLVAHRRAGKTVAAVNDMIREAVRVTNPYAYFAPYRSQAKAVVWDYFKYYAGPVLEKVNEAELELRLINGASIRLFGADNADAARGLGFGGVYLDEYGDFRPSVWGNVIRPTLSDRKGWGVFGGTPKGHNQFYDIHRVASRDKVEWFSLVLKASESGILDPGELLAVRQQLTEDQYNQEYECSFDAAILGAYYGAEMAKVDAEGRIRPVPYDESVPVNTAWDLGYKDDTAIWWYQNVGQEIHVLDHISVSGANLEELASEVTDRPYVYQRHWLPHDAKAKTLASGGKSIVEQMAKFLGNTLAIVPELSVQDGIQAARAALPRCYFDPKCNEGTEALRQYQREYDEDKKAFRKQPLHNWASHPADAFRMLAVAERGVVAPPPKPAEFSKLHQAVTLDELWEIHEQRLMETTRI